MVFDHELKIWPVHYRQVISGNKKFEIRDNSDRCFQKGDIVKLLEYDNDLYDAPPNKRYTGNWCIVKIIYVTNAYQKDNYVVFGFEPID